MQNNVKIIGGKFKGSNLAVANAPGLRPTNIRLRETLFNWLSLSIQNSKCLDLFAGSGALSFEAISRGAKSATAVDILPENIQNMQNAKTKLSADNLSIEAKNALAFIESCSQSYDIIFLDPPFNTDLLDQALAELASKNYLNAKLIYIEFNKAKKFALPKNYKIYKSSSAGQTSAFLMQKI